MAIIENKKIMDFDFNIYKSTKYEIILIIAKIIITALLKGLFIIESKLNCKLTQRTKRPIDGLTIMVNRIN